MERKLRKKRERARPVSCPAGGERVRVRGGVRTQNVIIHDVLSPPLRDAPPHGITPLRYSDLYMKGFRGDPSTFEYDRITRNSYE